MSKKHPKNPLPPTTVDVPLLQKAAWWLVGIIHIVCPLLFFTNLTRNPYYTQITLLNVLISLTAILWAINCLKEGKWNLPRVPFEKPLLIFLGIAAVSTTMGWVEHPMFRTGIFYESLRVWMFTLVNSIFAFYLPIVLMRPFDEGGEELSIWSDIIFCVLWGSVWLGFQTWRSKTPGELMWDPMGFVFWSIFVAFAIMRVRKGLMRGVFHLAFCVALLASFYGLLQYNQKDPIWLTLVQPYGGRPVSTFGNPNFLSSYVMLICPLAFAFAFQAKRSEMFGYLLVSLISGIGVIVTLTRSSYLGLVAGFIILAGLFVVMGEGKRVLKWTGAAAVLFILFIFIFPESSVSSVNSPISRFTEVYHAIKSGEVYAPWHQRILIWSSAWEMVKENPFFGKGWGNFELFYPFYQGGFLMDTLFENLRTHANNAHNILLEIWAQVGTLGAGVAIWLFVTILMGGWTIFRQKSNRSTQFIIAGLLAGFIGMVVDNFFGNVSIFFAVPAFMFWWNVGAIYNEQPSLRTVRSLNYKSGGILVSLVMFISVANIIYFGRRWNQERYYFAGFKDARNNKLIDSIKNLDEAYSWFRGEVNGNYEWGNSLGRYAAELADRGRDKKSLEIREKSAMAYQAALDANPGYDEIYFNLGVTQAQMGQRDAAIRNLEIALVINPLLRNAYGSLGTQLLAAKNLKRANAIFAQGAAVNKYDKEMWNNLGYTYMELGEHKKALDAFRRAYQLDPSFKAALQNLMNVTTKLGVEEPLFHVPALIRQMETALSQKNYQAARGPAEKLVELLPINADAHLSLGNIYFYLGDTEKAIDQYNQALLHRPHFDQALVNLAKLHISKNDWNAALPYAREVTDFHPGNKEGEALLRQIQQNL